MRARVRPCIELRQLLRKNLLCHYCSRPAATWDHIVPLALGGSNFARNMTPACGPCNEAKGAQMPCCQCGSCRGAVEDFLASLSRNDRTPGAALLQPVEVTL